MRALFAYLLAVSVALGGGYAGLRWLAAPDTGTDQHSSASAKMPSKNKKPPETNSSVTQISPVESRTAPAERDKTEIKTEITASTAPAEPSNKAATEAFRGETDVSEVAPKLPTEKDKDVPTGGCMPIGLTAQGELVFPIQCQALLERHRAPRDSQLPVPSNSAQSPPAPKERQAPEPAGRVGDENKGQNRNVAHSNEAAAKVEDVSPSGEVKPSKENSEPEAVNGKKVGKRNMQSSRSKPVMMILRTIEFPDGHREQRLLPISRSRRTAFRTEAEWFNPLTFR